MTNTRTVAAADLDLRGLLRPGDSIVCGQACAEPLTLTRKLLAEAGDAIPLQMFLGATMSRSFDGALPAGLRFCSYGAIGRTASLADRGLLDIVPERYSRLVSLFERGALRCDVALLQLSPGTNGGPPSLGLANDYVLAAARRARVVIAECNEQVPWTHGAALPPDLRIDHWVAADSAPVQLPAAPDDGVAQAIGRHVAGLVPDGATLQVGVGALADASLRQLKNHKALGIHSGVLGDAGAELMESGAVTNESKGLDAGITVTNTVCGSTRLYALVHHNRSVEVRQASHTHEAAVLARLHRFHAINGALQVDLSGQINCEAVDGKQRGGVGGLPDFGRAGRQSDGGRSITVLAATAAGGSQSRIVAGLNGNPVTIARADADVVVTEYGVAELRDVSLNERARRLIAVAAPQFRDELRHAWQHGIQGAKA